MRLRRMGLIGVAVVALVCLSGCEQLFVPQGAAPLRYRDDVFTAVTTTTDITYGTATSQAGNPVTLVMDLRAPTGDTVSARPVIVFVHGGGFSSGTKTSPEIVDEAVTFAKKGYVTASISYRLTPGGCSAGGPTIECVNAIIDAREDAQAAIRFLRGHAAAYGLDPTRFAIAGTSAGAITALEVGYSSAEDPTAATSAAVSLSGARLFAVPNPGDPAALLFHGTADSVVPFAWAQNTLTAAKDQGVWAVMTSWEGDGHVPYVAHRQQILDETRNFLYYHLQLGSAEGA